MSPVEIAGSALLLWLLIGYGAAVVLSMDRIEEYPPGDPDDTIIMAIVIIGWPFFVGDAIKVLMERWS